MGDSEPMGPTPRLRGLQSRRLGLLRYLLLPVSGLIAEAAQVRHTVRTRSCVLNPHRYLWS